MELSSLKLLIFQEGAFRDELKKLKKTTPKIFFIYQEMELSSSSLKSSYIFSKKRFFLYFRKELVFSKKSFLLYFSKELANSKK